MNYGKFCRPFGCRYPCGIWPVSYTHLLRNGWDFAEQRAKLDEPFTIEAEKKHARIVLNIIKKTTNDVPLTVRDFDVKDVYKRQNLLW